MAPPTRPTRQSRLQFGGNEVSSPPPPPLPTVSASATPSELDSDLFDETNSLIPPFESSVPTSASTPTISSENARPKKRRPRTSHIYKYMRDIEFHGNITNSEGKETWPCRFCTQVYDVTFSTTNPSTHLATVHGIKSDSPANITAKNIQLNIQQASVSATANPHKRRRLNLTDSDDRTLDPDTLEILYVKFIVSCNQPLRLVECEDFRTFLTYLNDDISTWLPGTHNTVREWVTRQFGIEKNRVKTRLQASRSKIHLSLDVWTSPNNKPIMGIIAHSINEDNILDCTLLGLKEVHGSHTGENLAPVVMAIIQDWGIASKLGYIVADNASNNDTMMVAISKAMLYDLSIVYDPVYHRIRCQGHIINLAVNSFLFVTDSETLENNEDLPHVKQSLEQIEEFRKYGPPGKLHNIVVHVQSSLVRCQEFEIYSKGRRLRRDNKTRWNSWSEMIRIARQLKDAINTYNSKHDDLEEDRLSAEDWVILQNLHDFLDELRQTTKDLESSTSTLDSVLPAMDYILGQFETYKEANKDNPVLAPMFNSGWQKMEKYYSLSDKCPVYVAALVLNPNLKWTHIERNWKADWIWNAKAAMLGLWEENKPQGVADLGIASTTSFTADPRPKNSFRTWMNAQQKKPNLTDEYARYCAAETTYDVDPRQWWMETTQQQNYPHLSVLALDILSIPAMSAAPERLFSSARLVVTHLRNKLGMDILEAFECLKSWYKLKEWNNVDWIVQSLIQGGEDLGNNAS